MTIELSPEDALELRLLLATLKRDLLAADMKERCGGNARIPAVDRELRRGVEALERLLGSLPH